MKVCFDIRIPCSAFYKLDVFFKSEYLHIHCVKCVHDLDQMRDSGCYNSIVYLKC